MNKTDAPAKHVAIVQSCYIPWKGYFDLINLVDEFVLYDDRQYTRRDWRNRNRIKTPNGTSWLSVPVEVKGHYHQRIDETVICDPSWAERHWETLRHNYRTAPCFEALAPRFQAAYERAGGEGRLSAINRMLLEEICDVLGIDTALRWSTEYEASDAKTARLVSICREAGATSYLTGPSARAYLDEAVFDAAGIDVKFMDYAGYPEYPQLFGPFEHSVTILDLLFNVGPDAPRWMKSFSRHAELADTRAG